MSTLDDAVVLGRTAAAGTDDADRMRVVDHDERVVALGELADAVEPSEVAVHREDAVGGDQAAWRAPADLEPRLELVHVAVRVAQPLRLAEPDPVDDRGG